MSEPQRDRWGRYKLPHPDTGAEVAWTRATTLAKALDDMTYIHRADMRKVVHGLMQRDDLQALALATDLDEKKQYEDLFEQCRSQARAGAKANNGTALHKFTQRLDQGQEVRGTPLFERDVAAYRAALVEAQVEISGRYIERITVVPEISVAGTMDRIARYQRELYIADLKTGSVDFNHSIAIQLAIYSRGHGLWNPFKGEYDPMPKVNQDRAIVIHLPAGEAAPALYWIDIASGWEMAKVCYQVREFRKRRDLMTPFSTQQEVASGV